nr:polysaccharide biosynthesis C-terminal domain-containing protein [Saprospiraceae bacterium]
LYGSLGIYFAILIAQMWYVRRLGQLRLRPKLSALKKGMVKEMARFSLFGFLGSLGSRLSSEFLNFFMLGTLATLDETGVYAIAYAIANVVDVPRKAISRIVSPLLADKFKGGKIGEVEEIYHKTSLNQLIAGLLVFLSIWVSIDQIYQIMPNGESFAAGKYVVLLLGVARIVDMMTGANSEILSYSKHYRFNFYLVLLMAVVHVLANIYFIKNYGLIGVGIATLLTLTIYNLAKFLVLQWKLGMQPFTNGTLMVLLAAGIGLLAPYLVPTTRFALIDAGIRSGLFAGVFAGLILWWRLSPDLNLLAEKTVLLARKWLRLR